MILQDEDGPALGKGAVQDLLFKQGDAILASGYPADPSEAKGVEQVLRERGLFDHVMTLNGGKGKDEATSMVARLERCLDLKVPMTLLEKKIEERGHLCVFGPKFHCECSAIELLWGCGKFDLCSRCDYSSQSLRRKSLQAF